MVASRTVRPVRSTATTCTTRSGPARTRTNGLLPGGVITYPVQIQNDGEDVDSFTFGGAGSDSLFTVRYLSGYYDITAKVIAGQAIIRNVAPGGVRTIAVQITVAQDAPREPASNRR